MEVLKSSEYDFATGERIDSETINEWHKQVLEDALKNPNDNFSTFIASGNSMVICEKEGNRVVVYEITNGYKQHSYLEKELFNKLKQQE